MKESYNFDNAGVRPIRPSGTRWISHKIGAMTQILDTFGLHITHSERMLLPIQVIEQKNAIESKVII